jgi:predicted kinase
VKTLYLLRGLQGCGKSSLARLLVASFSTPLFHYEFDDFFTSEDGIYKFDKSLIKEAHDSCYNRTEATLRGGHSVVVSNTFAEVWQLERYIKLAEACDAVSFVMLVEGDFGSDKQHPPSTLAHTKKIWQPYATDWQA